MRPRPSYPRGGFTIHKERAAPIGRFRGDRLTVTAAAGVVIVGRDPADMVSIVTLWFTMWFLLAGRVSWRRLYPCAITTGAFWMGMLAVFAVIFSGMVISYDEKYEPIGVVFGLMAFFTAVGW